MQTKDITELLAEYAQEVKDFGHVEKSTSYNEILESFSSLSLDRDECQHIKHIGNDALRSENHELRQKLAEALKAPQAVPAVCEWTQDPDFEMGDTYHSSCGELWSFIDGGPKENRVSYCHHCGKKVQLAAAPKGAV